MTDYTSQIDAWYQAIQYRTPPASELAQFNAQLQAGIITTGQAVSQIEASFYTQTYVDPIIREYQAAFGRVPDQAGAAYWVGTFAANPSALSALSIIFANSAEFNLNYGASATTPANSTLVTALYTNILGRAPDAAGLAYWSSQPLTASQLLQAFAQSAEFIVDTGPYVVQFQNAEVTNTEPTSGSLYNQAIPGGVYTYNITYGAPTSFTISGILGGVPVTGTVAGGPTGPISSTEAASNSNVTVNAVLGLNNFQSIVFTGINNVLNADYTTGGSSTNSTFPGSNFTQSGLNIRGVQTWNIQADAGTYAGNSEYATGQTISFTGDAAQGNVISGLQTVNFNDNSGITSLLIGDNSEPVQEPLGANGFAINVSNAVGTGWNGVDVDIAAQAFTGKDTIHVGAYIVGGFPQFNGSYNVPALELVAAHDGDDYNPNWAGWQDVAFGIAAGASASSLTTLNGVTLPPTGAVGFQNWVIASTGAKSVGSVNVLALGNEGSWNAQTITLTDDGSTTFLFATALSDSLSTDWQNIATVDLSGTSGQVVITGAETDAQIAAANGLGSEGATFVGDGGGGLLTSDTSALVTIKGGTGNSFYDLSSLTVAAATNSKASFQGGTSTKGNSEVSFNNAVFTAGKQVNISNIQVLDDTGNPVAIGSSLINGQGGIINMADFATLAPLNTNYDLLSGPLGNLIGGSIFQSAIFAFNGDGTSTDIAPAGYQLLQLLNADGSTENVLTSDLSILDGFVNFAVNMIDVADGSIGKIVTDGYTPLYGLGGYTIGTDPNAPGIDPFAAGNAIFVTNDTWDLYSYPLTTLTGHDITIFQQAPGFNVNVQSHLKLWLADEGVNVYKTTYTDGGKGVAPTTTNTLVGTIFDAPQVVIDNYTTVDIYLPNESVKSPNPQGDPALQNWVVLGSQQPTTANGFVGGFIDQPIVTVPLTTGPGLPPGIVGSLFAEVNFFDNTVDNGGSPPGGADNLVLGFTNFTADLAPLSSIALHDPTGSIGNTTVTIDATSPTAIFDWGHGSFEIGATNAVVLFAQNTSHLIMDLPGVPQYIGTNGLSAAHGIVVAGSLTGQNLIQGSIGVNDFDTNGHLPPAPGIPTGGDNGVLIGEAPLQLYHIGNDYLTGGGVNLAAGAKNLVGNTGDNFFPEGGIDTVALAPDHGGTGVYDTVWVAQIDVSSIVSAPTSGAPVGGVLPHYIYGQAVTDIVGGAEVYVDGYGPGVGGTVGSSGITGSTTSLLTVTGFNEGSTNSTGDVLTFNPNDWAFGALTKPAGVTLDNGLVDAFTGVRIATTTSPIGAHESAVAGASGGNVLAASTTLVIDENLGYHSASQLVGGLTNALNAPIAGLTIGANTTEHILVAYQNANFNPNPGEVTIADVTITNTGAAYAGNGSTASNHITVSAVDMVNIVGTALNPVTLGSLNSHDIQFLHT